MASAFLVSACAGSYQPNYTVNQFTVFNNTSQVVRDVSIRSGNRVVACGNIPASRFCSDRFPRRRYDNSLIEVEWALGQDAPRKETLTVEVPLTYVTGVPVRGVLEINSADNIEAYFKQDTPVR